MKMTAAGCAKRVARLQNEIRAQELGVVYLYDPTRIGWATGSFRDLAVTGEMKHPLLCAPLEVSARIVTRFSVSCFLFSVLACRRVC